MNRTEIDWEGRASFKSLDQVGKEAVQICANEESRRGSISAALVPQ